jgi:hypothetical protein
MPGEARQNGRGEGRGDERQARGEGRERQQN